MKLPPNLKNCDGFVVGSPVYYASANATVTAFLDRLFYSTHFDKRMKVGASVVAARRGGLSSTFDQLNKYFTISGMPLHPASIGMGFTGETQEKLNKMLRVYRL